MTGADAAKSGVDGGGVGDGTCAGIDDRICAGAGVEDETDISTGIDDDPGTGAGVDDGTCARAVTGAGTDAAVDARGSGGRGCPPRVGIGALDTRGGGCPCALTGSCGYARAGVETGARVGGTRLGVIAVALINDDVDAMDVDGDANNAGCPDEKVDIGSIRVNVTGVAVIIDPG